jgi:hypothetical protein
MRLRLLRWLEWPLIFVRLAFALFVCLPVILLDEKLTQWRKQRRWRRGG